MFIHIQPNEFVFLHSDSVLSRWKLIPLDFYLESSKVKSFFINLAQVGQVDVLSPINLNDFVPKIAFENVEPRSEKDIKHINVFKNCGEIFGGLRFFATSTHLSQTLYFSEKARNEYQRIMILIENCGWNRS